MFKNLKITCDEATAICDKNQYGEATFKDKLNLKIHFIRCKICSLYSKQNILLTKIYKSQARSCKKQKHCMNDKDKNELKEKLNKIVI